MFLSKFYDGKVKVNNIFSIYFLAFTLFLLGLFRAAWCGISRLLNIVLQPLDICFIERKPWRWEVVSLTLTPYPFFFTLNKENLGKVNKTIFLIVIAETYITLCICLWL